MLVDGKGIMGQACNTDEQKTEGKALGDFTHPSGREERAGGVT